MTAREDGAEKLVRVRLDDLAVDPAIQFRSRGLGPATLEDYAAALAQGTTFPLVVAFQEGAGV